MPTKNILLAELKHEAASTRKLLVLVPTDKLNWQPHEKSMKLGRLAKHVAELNMWISRIINADDFNFATAKFNSEFPVNTDEILKTFDQHLAEAIGVLETVTDETLDKQWSVYRGEQLMFQLPKKVALRSFAFNHIYHHRGQLSVYFRLLDISIPGMYGPSADEKMF